MRRVASRGYARRPFYGRLWRPSPGWDPSALFVAELVADAPDGQNHLRVLGVVLDLGSQAVDVRVNRAVVALVGVVPDLLQEVLPREDAAGVGGEESEQLELLGREFDLPVADRHLALGRVDAQAPAEDGCVLARLGARGRADAAHHALEARFELAQD